MTPRDLGVSAHDGMADAVAILTALNADDTAAAARITGRLASLDKTAVIAVLAQMLIHEVRLGSADAGIGVADYLQMIGLAVANYGGPT